MGGVGGAGVKWEEPEWSGWSWSGVVGVNVEREEPD